MRFIWGIIVILVGLNWLLKNMGLTDISVFSYVVSLWPLVLTYYGTTELVKLWRSPAGMPLSVINAGIAALGLLLTAGNLDLISFGFGDIFKYVLPVIVILAGISLLQATRDFNEGSTHWAVMSGLELGETPFKLNSGNLLAVMGGGTVDLTRAEITDPEIDLNCLAVMGGWEIKVPADVRVTAVAQSFLGGVEILGETSGGFIARRSMSSESGEGPLIRINAYALMGGIEIKRV